MKKILILIIATFMFVGVKAAGFSLNVSCPASANASSTVSCTISANSSNSWKVCAIQMNYSLSGGATFSSFTENSLFDDTNKNANGALLNIKNEASCFSTSASLGTIKFNMPASGSATLTINNIEATDSSGNEGATASTVTKTIRVKSDVNTLSNISLSSGTLSPSFDMNTTSYTATVDAESIIITTTKTDSNSSVSGDGNKKLNYGTNVFDIVVTSESGSKKTYTITITRPDNRENINTLSSLSITNVNISPSFTSSNTSYTAKVKSDVEKITVTATLSSAKSSFVSGYGSREVKLEYGSNKVQVKVLSESQKEKVYTIVVTREDDRSTNNFLKQLTIDEGNIDFDENNTEYFVIVNYDIEKVNIDGTVSDSKAKATGFGEKTLAVGDNMFEIIVTAENGKTKTYKVNVKRLTEDESVSSNADLKFLEVEGYTLNFDKNTLSYRLKLVNDITKLNINYETDDSKAIVNLKGNDNLKDGSVVVLQVTSTDGTVKEYEIIIDKDEPKASDEDKSGDTLLYAMISIISILLVIVVVIIIIKRKNKRIKLNY